MISLAEQQQKALIKFDTAEIEKITSYQEDISRNFKQTEELRIALLMNWLKISRREATNLHLSTLEEYFHGEELIEIRRMRSDLRTLLSKLNNFNVLNRVLANRARNSVKELLSIFTSGTNHVCNVKV
jgi:hypothetical protein